MLVGIISDYGRCPSRQQVARLQVCVYKLGLCRVLNCGCRRKACLREKHRFYVFNVLVSETFRYLNKKAPLFIK
ncbi:hypothetical protein B0W48_18735 [Pseudoalteromonas aliena]|uniref:Uncharacterized protein n=1 Tax=Pseudoalteromonas aliena TaxID=247523 RepID=A0A1Q2H2P9_9GAMM|nr:hypothetical protein B0W48_18735 [Pseudoalteromonas aliena]